MPDNTKNGIIDLTEIVEMGTPPEPAVKKTIPASPAGTVDFESELEDLFNTTDFSEFTDSADSSSQPAESSADLFADTPNNEPAKDDFLADFAPEMSAPTPSGSNVAGSAPSFESDLDDLLDSADAQDSSVGFDADFEDLLNEFSESPASVKEPVHQPDFDEDLSSMSMNFATPEPVVAEPAPQPQAVASEPAAATKANIADVSDADVDDLFADLDFELGEAPAEPASLAPAEKAKSQATDDDLDDLFADFDFETASVEEPVSQAVSVPSAPQSGADDDLLGDLGLDFDLDEPDAKLVSESQAQAAPESVPAPDKHIADVSDADVDDLFADLDFELGEAPAGTPVESKPEPVAPPSAPASSTPVQDISLEDPFDVDDILNEFSDDAPSPAQEDQDDFDLADLDELLRVDDEPAQAPRTDLTAADGTTLESEEVEMDDIGFLLSELDEYDGAQAMAEPIQEPVAEPEVAFEPDSPVEAVIPEIKEPSAPVDGSMFDAEIDALLDDIEMASAEPAAPISSDSQPAPVSPELEVVEPESVEVAEEVSFSVEPVSTPEVPEDDFDLDALLEDDPFEISETPEAASEVETNSTVAEDELNAELDALLNDATLDGSDTQAAQEDASPLGSADEFESILDELDSLLDEQEALEPVMEATSEGAVDELLATPVEDVLQDDVELDFEPEADLLGEPMSLEEDLDSTLDRILGEEPLSADVMGDVAEDDIQSAVEPAEFTHDDIETLFSDADASEPVMEEGSEGEPDLSLEAPLEDLIAEDAPVMDDPSAEAPQEMAVEPELVAPEEIFEPIEQMSEDSSSVFEAMEAVEQEVPMAELEQEAMTDLESLADFQPESVDVLDDSSPKLDMVDINENAAPIPPNASIEDLMRESSLSAPEFADSSMEMLDTTPAVSSAVQDDEPYDVPPMPVMTPEEFAELTERIYYLESTLQDVVAMQESFAVPQPTAVDKAVLKEAIDDAFNLDGPLMARVLNAVEVRTEMMIESMGNRIEGHIKGTIEQAAAKSAAQVIREELQALLAEDLSSVTNL